MAESFLTQNVVLGAGGLDLRSAVDEVDTLHLTRMTNVDRREDGSLQGRAGQTPIFVQAGDHHTLVKLDFRDTSANAFDYIAGISSDLFAGTATPLTLLESGFSGNPMVPLVYHPPISGKSWLVLTEGTKMRKTEGTLSLPLGLALGLDPDQRWQIDDMADPSMIPVGNGPVDRMRFASFGFTIVEAGPGVPGNFTTYGPLNKKVIDNCDSATGWVGNAGTGTTGTPTVTADTIDKKEGAASSKFATDHGSATGAYYNFYLKPLTLDLSTYGTAAIEDDDIIHLWIKADHPELVAEILFYVIVAADFDDATLPGTDPNGVLNSDFYIRAFRANDFTPVYEITATTIPTATVSNENEQELDQLPQDKDKRKSTKVVKERKDKKKKDVDEIDAGRGTWSEHGILGVSLKRGDFSRIGTDLSRGWGTVTGLGLVVSVTDASDINAWLDDIYIRGGAGPDTSLTGMTPYDYRYINYDPRTGAMSNPSNVQNPGFQLDSLRQAIILNPLPYGDSAIRQQFFRRGGTLQNQWYFLGQNTADGADFTDDLSDLEISAADTLEIDNDQPVTTVNSAGTTILAQPLKAIFGPLNDIVFGCGDPFRAGDLYWCKPLQIDHWPSAYHVEVCAPSEELMNGAILGGQAYVFSRARGFTIIPNLTDVSQVTTLPTGCQHGLAARQGICATPVGIFFVAEDGIYRMAGGGEENVTDRWLYPLFNGITKNGYAPIDFTQPDAIHLTLHDNEVWFLYRDTNDTAQCMIYSISFNYWRHHNFNNQISTLYSDRGSSDASLLLGGRSSGKSYINEGVGDDGTAINCDIRTGSQDQGFPREDKIYGDIALDIAQNGVLVNVTSYINNDVDALATQQLTGQANPAPTPRDRKYIAIPDPDASQGRNMAVDIAWSSASTLGTPVGTPIIYRLGISYTPQVDTIEQRPSNWDNQGSLTDKWVKGLMIECDTFGENKQLQIFADGVMQTGVTLNADGRQVIQTSFDQFQARLLRFTPTGTGRIKIYQYRWMFDEEPLSIVRWESQEIDHGIVGWQTPYYANITLRSKEIVDLLLYAYRSDGTMLSMSYQIPSTNCLKVKQYVQFEATKGVLFKYIFTSTQPFWLYREESSVAVQPWGGQQTQLVQPFGTDDLDRVRQPATSGRVGVVERFGLSNDQANQGST